jgi:uncharacterized protein
MAPAPASLRTPLSGSRCPDCGVVTYPTAESCPRCGSDLVHYELPTRGALWSWTVQRYPPKSPPFLRPEGEYQPFVVGYVELKVGIRVEAIIEVPVAEVEIGMPLELGGDSVVPRASAVVAQ